MMNLFGETPVRKLLTLHALSGETLVEETATPGNPCTFETDVAKPLKKLVIPFADENGITGFSLHHAGKNIFDGQFPNISEGLIYYRKYFVGDSKVIASTNFPQTNYGAIFVLPGDVGTGASTGTNNINENITRVVTPVNGYITIAYRIQENKDPRDYHVQIEYGQTASTYEAYDGHTYNFTWTDSATAGSYNAFTGELTITSPESKTVALEPISVTALVGDNVLWSDANGNLEVKYMKKG